MFRAAPQSQATEVRTVVLAGVLMVLLAVATIVSVPLAPTAVTLALAAAALAVRPLVVAHVRRGTRAERVAAHR
jgi:heme A synthase